MVKHLNKLILYSVLFIVFFFLIPMITNDKNISVVNNVDFKAITQSTQYKDYGDSTRIDSDYSYSTLFYTEETKFIVLYGPNAGKTYTGIGKVPQIGLSKGKNFGMIITKCAINKDGQLLDVFVRIRNVNHYGNGGSITLSIKSAMDYQAKQSKPKASSESNDVQIRNLKVGDPIMFGLGASTARCDFSLTYYLTDTYEYNSSSQTVTGDLGNITHVNGMFYDLDVPRKHSSKSVFLAANEGIVPREGASTIYYNLGARRRVSSSYFNNYELAPASNGISIYKNDSRNANGIWFATTVFMLTKNLSNSFYEFTYGGDGCGIGYLFASPYPYTIDSPNKSASVENALGGESFIYTVSQYVPNNYYGTLFNFSDVYENLYADTKFTLIDISDTIDDNLILDVENIKILNEKNEDVSSYFEITIDGNKVTATALSEILKLAEFYNHTYNLELPVTMKKGLYDVDYVPNVGQSTSKINGDPPEPVPTPEVDVKVRYSLTVNYYNEATGEKIEESDYDDQYFNGDPYTTNRDKVGEEWDLVDDPPNMNGVIHEDTVVNYYFIRFHTLPVTGGSGKKYIIIAGLVLILISLIIVLLKIKSLFA